VSAPVNTAASNGHGGESAAVDVVRQVVGQRLAATAATGQLDPAGRAAAVDDLITRALDEHARQALRSGRTPLTPDAEQRVARAVRNTYLGLGGLQPLLDDPDIETININGCDNVWGTTVTAVASGSLRSLPPTRS